MKKITDYFKGRKSEFTPILKAYYRSSYQAELESEQYCKVKFCEWYITIDGDIDFANMNPLKANGSIDWKGLNEQIERFIKKAGKSSYTIEFTTRNTTDGIIDNFIIIEK